MASHDSADLLGIGEHCAAPGCGQVDFLPFRCDCCSKSFCLDHRSYAAHACVAAGQRVTEVIVCPLCAKGVRLQPGQDPNVAFDQHAASTACDPRNYAKVHQKKRCPVGRCHEKLSLTNTYHCKACNQRVCLKHRMPDDHACAQAKADQAAQAVAAAANRSKPNPLMAGFAAAAAMVSRPAVTTSASRSQPTIAPTAARPPAAVNPTNTVGGTAARRMQSGAGPTVASLAAGTAGVYGSGGSAGVAHGTGTGTGAGAGGREECPQCGGRFATVDALIRHVEEWHPSPGASTAVPAAASSLIRPAGSQGQGAGATAASGNPTRNPLLDAGVASGAGGTAPRGEYYRCTHCGNTFSDPVVLVRHSEACARHGQAVAATGGSSGDAGGRGKSDCTIS